MTSDYSNEGARSDDSSRSIRDAFAALPFEKKISTLIRIELDMFGDAIDTVMTAASRAADKVADALSGKESQA
ncbi:MAG TPA: hypothetical protein VNN73_01745 [Blastocatellia bacterium]|nr:hypothetical protein [Blastocatellia bacterium]